MDTDTRSTIALLVSIGSLAVSGAGFAINAFRGTDGTLIVFLATRNLTV